ncbi:6886_t:CDS:2 [Diversispora eburnea]|uniref:6886_t:CDS:1 n=1 Tax=Diversispora eburnea TaxID=1213867 RepID=A0A9N8YL02_9GLOM|nr:6886_t:CDS:2 [Diversispora eburnea]
MARLIIDKKDYGIHSFLVQLRGEGHKPLPGIEIGDIGPKLGYNNIDNGFLRFTKVRIPRTNMLMKFSKVSPSGIYSTPPHAKMVYGTLIDGRADIISKAAYYLTAILTIAIRYSIIRKQGNKFSSQDEFQIIDYQSQQYKLFNGLSRSYTFLFTSRFINNLYIENITKMEKGDVTLCTELVCESMEDARRCFQQGKFTGGIQLSYLMDFDKILYKKFPANVKEEHILHPESQIEALKHRYISLLSNLSSSLEKSSRIHPNNNNNTLKEAEAKSEHMIDIINVSRAYCYFILLFNAHQGLQSVKKEHPLLYPSLRSLIDLFFINVVLSQFGEFLITGYYNSYHINLLKNLQKELLKKIRVDAIGLVDAWEFSDNMLNSALGRYDGNVYEEMYKRVKMDPLNLKHEKGIYVGYNEL